MDSEPELLPETTTCGLLRQAHGKEPRAEEWGRPLSHCMARLRLSKSKVHLDSPLKALTKLGDFTAGLAELGQRTEITGRTCEPHFQKLLSPCFYLH